MRFITNIQDNIAVIEIHSRFMGLSESELLYKEVKNLINQGIINIVFDLENVDSINSAGIGILVSCFIAVLNIKGRFCLTKISEKVDNVLEVTQMVKIFEPFESLEEALESLKQ